jgi:CheY-like chemotaxis protein
MQHSSQCPQRPILVVEDNPLITEILQDSLETEGYEIHIATNGREALAQLQEKQFDCMLLDMFLPEMDGLDVIRQIKGTPIRKKLRILATSTSPHWLKLFSEGDIDGFLPRPFTFEELIAAVSELTRSRVA